MAQSIAAVAADPRQYDGDDLIWTQEGKKGQYNRRLYLEVLQLILNEVDHKQVLDIGCGQGWLCDEVARQGGKPLGLDSSLKNIQAARAAYPSLPFLQISLKDFAGGDGYDWIFAVMVLEHFLELKSSLEKIHMLMKHSGRFAAIVGDYDKFTSGRAGYPVKCERLADGEVATRTDYGERLGILCDIHRTVDRHLHVAKSALKGNFVLVFVPPLDCIDTIPLSVVGVRHSTLGAV
jgi:SAM-dependent methyltransferase